MRKDEILEEVWRARDDFARQYNYDLEAMVAALLELERGAGRQTIDRQPSCSPENSSGQPPGEGKKGP